MESLAYSGGISIVTGNEELSGEQKLNSKDAVSVGQRVPSVSWHSGLKLSMGATGPTPVTMTPMRQARLAGKRVFDIVAASLGVAFLAPLLIFVAIAIATTSKGPVLFRQRREGINGRSFEAFKFRSMILDQCDPTGVQQTTKDDARITAVGAFIRRTSIDELPQLFNVIRGDMSLVGPRPHVSGMIAGGMPYRALVPYYDARLAMRPGITGWAQASGLRGPTMDAGLARKRIDHDIAYIQNFSLWLDCKILAKTVVREFLTGSGD